MTIRGVVIQKPPHRRPCRLFMLLSNDGRWRIQRQEVIFITSLQIWSSGKMRHVLIMYDIVQPGI